MICPYYYATVNTFESRLWQGSPNDPLTPARLRELITKPDAGGRWDKIILAVHCDTTNPPGDGEGKNGIFLAVDKPYTRNRLDQIPNQDPNNKLINLLMVWGAAYTLEDIFGGLPPTDVPLDVFTCFSGCLPKSAGNIEINPIGNPDNLSRSEEYEDLAVKPWVYSECSKHNKPK